MSIVFPDLSQSRFTAIQTHVICSRFDRLEPGLAAELKQAFIGNRFSLTIPVPNASSGDWEWSLSIADTYGELEIDLGVRRDWMKTTIDELSRELGTIPETDSERAQPIAKFRVWLDKLQMLHDLNLPVDELPVVETTCNFNVLREELPVGGIVRRGIGARADFEEDVLNLAGAQFAINGDMSQTISWYVDPYELDYDHFQGQIFSRIARPLGDDLLEEGLATAQGWLERYILESGSLATR